MVLMLVIWFNKRIIVHFYYNRKDRQSLFESVHHKNVIFIHLLSLLPSLTFIIFYLRLQFTIWHLHSVKPTITVFIFFTATPFSTHSSSISFKTEPEALHALHIWMGGCAYTGMYQELHFPEQISTLYSTGRQFGSCNLSFVETFRHFSCEMSPRGVPLANDINVASATIQNVVICICVFLIILKMKEEMDVIQTDGRSPYNLANYTRKCQCTDGHVFTELFVRK